MNKCKYGCCYILSNFHFLSSQLTYQPASQPVSFIEASKRCGFLRVSQTPFRKWTSPSGMPLCGNWTQQSEAQLWCEHCLASLHSPVWLHLNFAIDVCGVLRIRLTRRTIARRISWPEKSDCQWHRLRLACLLACLPACLLLRCHFLLFVLAPVNCRATWWANERGKTNFRLSFLDQFWCSSHLGLAFHSVCHEEELKTDLLLEEDAEYLHVNCSGMKSR